MNAQLEAANKLYRAGRFSEAETIYAQIVARDPKNVPGLTGIGTIALWGNRLKEAEHYLRQADNHTHGLQRLWPLNANLKTVLAMLYYRMDNFPQSAGFFRDAAGLLPIGPFADLKALGQQLACLGSETPYIIEGPDRTQVKFVTTDPLPVVEISVNGSQPLLFFIDSGGAEIILDVALAQDAGIRHAGTMTGGSAGGSGHIGLGKIDAITIGDFTIRNVPVHIIDTTAYQAIFNGLNIQGVIGTRLLMHFLATIDYIGSGLILRRVTPDLLQQLECQHASQRIKRIPFWLIQSHYMVAWGSVNGNEPMLFFVDTGITSGFTPSEATLRETGITVDWSAAQEGVGGFGGVKTVDVVFEQVTLGTGIDQVVNHNLPSTLMQKSLPILGDSLGFQIGGAVSHQFFRNYALTLDFTGMGLYLEESASRL